MIQLLAVPAMVLIVVFFTTPVHALQTVPYKMNFQGRLTDASGNAMANGTYNMKFRIYDALTAGTQQWTETRSNFTTTGVTVTNGLFSVQLGDVTALPPAIFTNQNLYFEIELPTPATATCSTSSCESYAEGPMGPRNKLGTSAYAFNSDTLDGLDSTAFGQLGTANTWTGTNLVKTTSLTAFQLQNAAGTASLLTADTVNMQVLVANPNATSLDTTTYTDDFATGGPALPAPWTFYNGIADSSSTSYNSAVAGKLRIATNPTTTQRDCSTGTLTCLRVLRTAPSSDFTTVMKLDSLPSIGATNNNAAGIFITTDASQVSGSVAGVNFLRIEVDGRVNRFITVNKNVGGVVTNDVVTSDISGYAQSSIYLKVARSGDAWTVSYSPDDITYTVVGTFSLPMDLTGPNAKFGVHGDFWQQTSTYPTVDFDSFHTTVGSSTGTTALTTSGDMVVTSGSVRSTDTAAKAYFGDNGSPSGGVQNVYVGEQGVSNTDIAELHGKNGIQLTTGDVASVTNVALSVAANGQTVQIGKSATDATQVLLNLDSFSTFADTATCGVSTNQGSLYYNTISNAVRSCVNGTWEDLVTTSGLGLIAFGVAPDSGSGGGDQQSITGITKGPCKVSFLTTTTVKIVQGCTAYSGGRKVVIPDNTTPTGSLTLTNGNFVHVCLTGANGQPAFSASGTEAANLPTFSANNPILCLADIKTTAAALANIYDTRTYTTTDKAFATINAATASNGALVTQTATQGVVQLASAIAQVNVVGVVVATAGASATNNTVNMIIATQGLQAVKATGTSSVNSYVQGTATAGYTSTAAISANAYSNAGIALRTIDTTCTSASTALATCQFSQIVLLSPK